MMTRTEDIKNKVELLVRDVFNKEYQQLNKFNEIFNKDRCNRSPNSFTTKEYKLKILEVEKQINIDLDNYKNDAQFIQLQKFSTINKELLLECEKFDSKDLPILYIQYLTLTNKANPSLVNMHEWFVPKYYVPYEWTCSHCSNQNLFKAISRSPKNINQIKCNGCQLTVDSNYNNEFKYSLITPLKQDHLEKKFTLLEEKFNALNLSNEDESREPEWSKNERFLAFDKYKDKLSYQVQKGLNRYFNLPKKTSLKNDFELILQDTSYHELEKYKIIKIYKKNLTDFEIGKKLLYDHEWLSFKSSYMLNKSIHFGFGRYSINRIKKLISEAERYSFRLENIYPLDDEYTLDRYSEYDTSHYKINEYYFQEQQPHQLCSNKKKISIFQSDNQSKAFATIRKKHKKSEIIIPNYPLWKIIDFKNDDITQAFNNQELSYLKSSYFSFIVINKNGTLVKVYNLVIGYHHSKKDYQEKDDLKKLLCSILDIEFEEFF